MNTAATPATAPAISQATTEALDAPYPVTAAQVADFQRDGFVRLREVIPPVELAAWSTKFSAMVAARSASLPPVAERSTYGQAFLQISNLWTEEAEARRFVFSRRLAGIARALLGAPGIRLYHDQALFKEPGGGFTPWHFDAHYWPLDGSRTITAWVPLQATPLAMGPLEFAVGSHRLTARHRELDIDISDDSERLAAQRLSDLPMDQQPYAAGEVTFHSGLSLHRAGGNGTAQMRGVMTVIYHASDARVVEPRNRSQVHDLARWLPGCRPGDWAASPLNPLLDGTAPG